MITATQLSSKGQGALKQRKFPVFLMGAMALAFSYIITKDIVVPSWVIAIAALVGGFLSRNPINASHV